MINYHLIMEKEKNKPQKLSVNFYDKEFILGLDSYSLFLSISKGESLYLLAKKGLEKLEQDLDVKDMEKFYNIQKMLIEIEKNKKI